MQCFPACEGIAYGGLATYRKGVVRRMGVCFFLSICTRAGDLPVVQVVIADPIESGRAPVVPGVVEGGQYAADENE